jgi:hypothetical protein
MQQLFALAQRQRAQGVAELQQERLPLLLAFALSDVREQRRHAVVDLPAQSAPASIRAQRSFTRAGMFVPMHWPLPSGQALP